jgi:hypothetical protein
MDITFSCDKCGQSIVIDEAGAGITVDCPNCRQPVYVPTPTRQASSPVADTRSPRPTQTATLFGQQTSSRRDLPGETPSRIISDKTLVLKDGERVIRQERIHWVVYIYPLIASAGFFLVLWLPNLLFSILLGRFGVKLSGIFSILSVLIAAPIGVVGLLAAWVARNKAAVTLTNRRLVMNKGILAKTSHELLLKQSETVTVHHPLLGRILNYGTIMVHGTGGGGFSVSLIENPAQFYADLQDCLSKAK